MFEGWPHSKIVLFLCPFCMGCRRWLCFSNPKQQKNDDDRQHKKIPNQPKYFAVKTPVLDTDGGLQMVSDANGDESYRFEKEVGAWTCYHAAHQRGWKTYLQANRTKILGVTQGKNASGQQT